MARIKFTAFMADARGKVNGTVFSKNRGGAYTRTKVSPAQPRTSYQQNQKASLSAQSSAWRGLTAAQRATWNAGNAAFPYTDVFGDVHFLSGQQLFTKLNTNLSNAALSTITSCPVPAAVPAPKIVTLVATAGTPALTLTLSDTTVPTGNTLNIWASPQVGAGISFIKNKMRLLGKFTLTAGVPVILSTYTGRFGTLVAAKQIFIRAIYMSSTTGQQGVPAQSSCIIGA